MANKAAELTNQINLALDECAPYKRFKLRKHFRPGLSEKAKQMIGERNRIRKEIATAKSSERPALKTKYKQIRNRTITQIRNDTINRNGERIAGAKNEGETWKVVNEIIKPRLDNKRAEFIVPIISDGEPTDWVRNGFTFEIFIGEQLYNQSISLGLV